MQSAKLLFLLSFVAIANCWDYQLDTIADLNVQILTPSCDYYPTETFQCAGGPGIPPGDRRGTLGFWSSCGSSANPCLFSYYRTPNVIVAYSITIDVFFNGMASVVALPSGEFATPVVFTAENQWARLVVDLSTFPDLESFEYVRFTTNGTGGGFVVFDKFIINLYDLVTPSSTLATIPTTTTLATTTTAATTTQAPDTTSTPIPTTTTPIPTTSENDGSTTPYVKPCGHHTCRVGMDGNFPDPLDCTGFISCSNGYGYCMDCPKVPSRLYYHIERDVCDHPQFVVCEPRPIPPPDY